MAQGLPCKRRQAGAVAQGLGAGHGNAALGQVVHQFDVERQLGLREHLEQRQHVLAAGRVQEVVGILDTRRNPPKRDKLAQIEMRQEGASVVFGDRGEYGH